MCFFLTGSCHRIRIPPTSDRQCDKTAFHYHTLLLPVNIRAASTSINCQIYHIQIQEPSFLHPYFLPIPPSDVISIVDLYDLTAHNALHQLILIALQFVLCHSSVDPIAIGYSHPMHVSAMLYLLLWLSWALEGWSHLLPSTLCNKVSTTTFKGKNGRRGKSKSSSSQRNLPFYGVSLMQYAICLDEDCMH